MLLAAMFCYLFFYTGRQTFGFAIPGLKEEFGFSSAALGWAPGSRLLSNWWGVSERGKAYGLYVFAAGCASVLLYVISIVVIDVMHLDWCWIFRLHVLLILMGGIVFYLVACERPEDMGFEPLADTGVANADDQAKSLEGEKESSWERYKVVLKNKRLLIAALSLGISECGPLRPDCVGAGTLSGCGLEVRR
ncbi:MFS transporter [Alcaligenes faecalis]|uniref:MFS transporter n=1 Tax=Alcaligenes faecalis TaxID=511 RepID=UPI001F0073B7|nr:MFS transporter [Alcaligenes faecalis]